jgi:hypothetical protein
VAVQDGQQLLVVNVPRGPAGLVLAEESDVGQELPKPFVW